MAENTEQIEAKLAAYVDGMLDDAERAQIEAHLKTNPQHRALLDDLVTHRLLLRDLPKATAPPEVIERMEAHLERSGLLDDTPHEIAHPGRRDSRWGRVAAIAAVLLLAVGLAGLVMYVTRIVPGTTVTTALNNVNEPAATTRPSSDKSHTDAEDSLQSLRENDHAGRLTIKPAGSSPGDAERPPVADLAKGERARAELVEPTASTEPVAEEGATARKEWTAAIAKPQLDRILGDSQRPRVVLVVATNQLAAANERIQAFLQDGRFAQEPLRQEESSASADHAGARVLTGALPGTTQPVAAEAGARGTPTVELYVAQTNAQKSLAGSTTRPAEEGGLASARSKDLSFASETPQVYVASGMTRGQVELLRQSLAGEAPGLRQVVYERPLVTVEPPHRGTDGPPAVLPATNESLSVKTDDLGASKRMGEAPMPRQADASEIDAPTTAAPPAAPETKQGRGLEASSQPATQAIEQIGVADAAADRSPHALARDAAEAAGDAADAALDVVIVVRNEVEPPATSAADDAPTTQSNPVPPQTDQAPKAPALLEPASQPIKPQADDAREPHQPPSGQAAAPPPGTAPVDADARP